MFALPSGDLLEYREKVNDIHDRTMFLSGSWEFSGGENREAHLNFRIAHNKLDLGQTSDVFPAQGAIRDDRLHQDYDRQEFEIGGDVTRPLLGGGIKLIGLATRQHRVNEDVFLLRVKSQVVGGEAYYVDSQRDETVGRIVWSRQGLGGWNVELGAEGAHNQLDFQADYFELDDANGRVRVDLPIDQATVTEYRGEFFLNGGRSLSPNLRADFGLTYETSRLTVRGDGDTERSLRFLKPKASFDWRPGGKWHAQFSITRTVAQLNFDDFTSSAELSNDRVNGGNAELLPQRAWEVLGLLEHPILGDGLAKVEAGYNHISLLQDRVPTPEGFDAPGNLGTGKHMFVRGTLDAPLGILGIKGGRLNVKATLQDTDVRDPYTQQIRDFSGFTDWELEAGFRRISASLPGE